MLVGRELTKLAKEFPQLEIKKVDILSSPVQSLQQGIRMIPTLQAGEQRLSGIFLSGKEIRAFVTDILGVKESA